MEKKLADYFIALDIPYEEKLKAIREPPVAELQHQSPKIQTLIHVIREKTQIINRIKIVRDYMEFGTVLDSILPLLESLALLLSSDPSKFYHESHYLLKYYWGIRFVRARFALEGTPEFCENQLFFFNMPDSLLEFVEELKAGPKPVEILGEVSIEVRIHKLLPLLIARGPDEIKLSPLAEKLLNAHTISDKYYYYLYDFEEEILD